MLDPNKITAQSALGRILRLPLQLVPSGIDVPVLSGPNKGLRWRTGASVHGCWVGTYESSKVDLLRRFVRPGMVAYDIGANAGYYTLLLSRLVGPSGRVVAFEPLPDNLASVLHHVRINDLRNVTVVEGAVSSSTGLAGFAIAASNSMGSLGGSATTLRVPTLTLDGLVESGALPPPQFVKMDVEGAEGNVLAGSARILRTHAATWFVALHGAEPAKASAQALLEAGYVLHSLDGARRTIETVLAVDEIFATGPGPM